MRAKDRPLVNDYLSDEDFDRLLLAWFGQIARVLLQKVAGDSSAAGYARVAAARGLIDSSFRAIELHDVSERLRRIEERLLSESGNPAPLSLGA